MALGIRKALALTSAIGFPLAALIDVSRWTVTRAEISTWSMLVSRARRFGTIQQSLLVKASKTGRLNPDRHCHVSPVDGANQPVAVEEPDAGDESPESFENMCMKDLKIQHPSFSSSSPSLCSMIVGRHETCAGFTLGLTEFCGDATNSSIWQNSKLSGLLVTSMFLADSSKLAYRCEARQAFAWHRTLQLGQLLDGWMVDTVALKPLTMDWAICSVSQCHA